MKIIDLNLIIYAVNDDAPQHESAKDWWEQSIAETETVGIPWVVILGFLRITTNPRIMPLPLAIDRALGLVNEWLNLPSIQIVMPTDRHWGIFQELIRQAGTAANLTTDAHLATLAIEHGAVFYSTDHDFARFPNLKWINPL